MSVAHILRSTALAALALVGALVFAGPAPADLVEDNQNNFTIETPYGWARLPHNPAWEKYGIVYGGERKLDKLKNDKPADGEGGWVHVAVTDMPEGKTLEDMSKDDEVRGFLLKRFADEPASWPKPSVVKDTDPDTGAEYIILKVDGKARNLKGKESRVRAVMLLGAAKKKLFKVRMYAWHTEYDEEGLKGDLDVIELSFAILDISPDAEEKPEGERPPEPGQEQEEVLDGDAAEEKVFQNKLVGWKLVKPKGLKSKEWDKEAQPDAVAWFEDSVTYGSYQIVLYVIRRGRQRNGQALPDMQLKSWGLDPWWQRFDKSHPEGPIRIWKFPKKAKELLVLPDADSEKMLFKEPKKRPKKPEDIDGSTMIKKWKNAEKVKGAKMGEEKCIEAYRGVLGANRPQTGREMVIRYMWGTPRLTCMLVVGFSREGYKKWGEQVQKLMDSIEMTGRPR